MSSQAEMLGLLENLSDSQVIIQTTATNGTPIYQARHLTAELITTNTSISVYICASPAVDVWLGRLWCSGRSRAGRGFGGWGLVLTQYS